MPKLASKHFNEERLQFVDFSGGLNLSKPPESLEANEMQAARNFEFSSDTGLLRLRGGLEPVFHFEYPIRDIFPIAGGEAALVRAGDSLYRLLNGVAYLLGSVDGDLPGAFEYFGEEGNVAMVFGGRLYLYIHKTITMRRIDSIDSPTAANALFYRAGRLAVTEIGSDKVRYSGVGDPEMWVDDPDDAQSSKFVTVGYLDGCQMAAVGNMVGETLVFKCPPGQPDNGAIYRLQGDFPNWTVIQYSRGASAWNSNALATVANNMLFLTRQGMSSMATAMEYGDFRLSWAGSKVNPKLGPMLTDKCRMWHIPIKGQVWVWDGQSKEIWVYHYQIGTGAWTAFSFPEVIGAAAAVDSNTYVGIGQDVYVLNDNATSDNLYDDDPEADVRVPIDGLWSPKTITRANELLVKKIQCNYLSTVESKPQVNIEGFRLPLPLNGLGDIATEDDDVAQTDPDPLVPSRTSTVRVRCNIRKWDVTPRIEVSNGSFSLSSLAMNVAEV
jgi:hypothetical protein